MALTRLPQRDWDIADHAHVIIGRLQSAGRLDCTAVEPGLRPRIASQTALAPYWLTDRDGLPFEASAYLRAHAIFRDCWDLWNEAKRAHPLQRMAIPWLLADFIAIYPKMARGVWVDPCAGPTGEWGRSAAEFNGLLDRYRLMRQGIITAHEMSTLIGRTYQHTCELLRREDKSLHGVRIRAPQPIWMCIAASAVPFIRDGLGKLDDPWIQGWRSLDHQYSHAE